MKLVRQRWMVLGLLLVGWSLRLHRLGDKSVWWDEGWSVWVARQSWVDILRQVGHDVHPPLYFWLLHAWRWGSGDSEFGLRAFSALLGVLTIAATYRLGKVVNGRATGLLAALFITVSRFNIAWSQEIRMYALVSLLAVLGVWAAIRVWDEGRPVHWLAYISSMIGGLLSLYLFFPIPIAINVAWLWTYKHAQRPWQQLLQWVGAQVAILAVVGLWLNYALRGFLSNSSASPTAPLDFLKIYWTVLTVGIPLNVEQYAPVTIPVLVIFAAGLALLVWGARRDWRQARHVTLFVSGLLIPIIVVYLVSIPKEGVYAPQFAPRYLVIYTAYYSILLAWGIVKLSGFGHELHEFYEFKPIFRAIRVIRGKKLVGWRWLVGAVLTAVTLYAAWVGLRSYHPGRVLTDDYNSLVLTIEAYKRPSDAVILFTDTDWPIFAYHHPNEWRGVPHAWQITPAVTDEFLAPIWESSDGVWLVITPYAGVSDPQGMMVNWLDERATAVATYTYGDKALHFYARTAARAVLIDELIPEAAPRFEETAVLHPNWQLTGYDQAIRDVHSGDTLHVSLFGRGDEAAASVGLVDEAGQVGQETAVTLPAATNLIRQQINLLISPDTPSGSYHFFIRDEQDQLVKLGRVNVRQRGSAALTTADVTIANRLDLDFADGIRLLGYEVETESPQPGGIVYLTLYWQAQQPAAQKYKVFTHLLGEVYNINNDNFLWGQQDNEPVNNSRPTTTWRSGEVIVDSYAIPIDAQAPEGTYQIEIGLYDPATGARLPLLNGGDRVLLTSVSVGQGNE